MALGASRHSQRDVGAKVSMLNSDRRGRRGWPLLDRLVTDVVLEVHMMWHLIAHLHDRREFPMLGHLPWGASEDGSIALTRR